MKKYEVWEILSDEEELVATYNNMQSAMELIWIMGHSNGIPFRRYLIKTLEYKCEEDK